MKVYFAGAIRGGRDDQEIYFSLIKEIQNHATVLTEHIGDEKLKNVGEADKDVSFIFRRDMDWVRESDAVIAEVTQPSLGVGYELGQAEAMEKPILCLFRKNQGRMLSAMVAGNPYPRVAEYETLVDAREILNEFFAQFTASETSR